MNPCKHLSIWSMHASPPWSREEKTMRRLILQQMSLRNWLMIAFGILLTGASGCASITMGKKAELPLAGDSTPSQSYTVEVLSLYSKGHGIRAEITEGLTVQGALEESGVLKTHRNPVVTIYRRIQENGQVLKLACEFQPNKKAIKFEQDYAVLPGDRIIVEPRPNPLEKLMGGK